MIACLCSHGFVEYLEVIDVGEQQRVISSRFAAYARVHALQTIHEHAAVRQAREQVVEEVVLKLLLGALALGDVAVDDDQLRDFALGVTNRAGEGFEDAPASVLMLDAISSGLPMPLSRASRAASSTRMRSSG